MTTPMPPGMPDPDPLDVTDSPSQLGPNHYRMDAPFDVTNWTVIRTTRNVVTDDGRGFTLRDEWWEVPSFVVAAVEGDTAPRVTPVGCWFLAAFAVLVVLVLVAWAFSGMVFRG